MRQAGFEPAHPEITRLKLVAFTARPLTPKHLKKYTAPYGARTRDPGLIRPIFYQLN